MAAPASLPEFYAKYTPSNLALESTQKVLIYGARRFKADQLSTFAIYRGGRHGLALHLKALAGIQLAILPPWNYSKSIRGEV
jgi:hypothetical protein